AMLRYIGVEDLWNSKFGTSLVLAIAWGASLGGFLTPLGGAPNLLAMKFVQDTVTHHEFLFMTWVTRLTPLTIAAVLVYLLVVSGSDIGEAARTPSTSLRTGRQYFFDELRALGSMAAAERWAL